MAQVKITPITNGLSRTRSENSNIALGKLPDLLWHPGKTEQVPLNMYVQVCMND